jgi:hypothetical protein
MKRDDAIILMDHFAKDVKHAGTTTALYHGYNGWTTYIVKDCRSTYESAHDWEVPGLFISFDEIRASKKPYVTIFYRMGCGRVLCLVIPVVIKMGEVKIPNNFTVLKRKGLFQGEEGLWIALEHWYEIGNVNDFVVKKGAKKRTHLAKKPEKAENGV